MKPVEERARGLGDAGAGAADLDATQPYAKPFPAPTTPDAEDERLLAAVREYVDALEAGQRPSRQEMLARYPDIARELSECLDGLAFVHSAAAEMVTTSGASPLERFATSGSARSDPATAEPLGDFRLVREIGRGGMGVVYEAVQLSLGRRVAVKVLPLASSFDARHLQRFRNEAQAAAQLHHTNIVPVYAVGCERSVHFYAMQLIEGQSLAEVVRGLRRAAGRPERGRGSDIQPTALLRAADAALRAEAAADDAGDKGDVKDRSAAVRSASSSTTGAGAGATSTASSARAVPAEGLTSLHASKRPEFHRAVARLGLQAAEALDYAHRQGVVHRDVKPANLLLDAHGTLWITDFGLAQFYTDANLTQSGDMLGTLRYMSPEQASGRAVVLDQRTDVYSLGVTLYELLTLEVALRGETREQILREMDTAEPRPPRSIDRSIPQELETILGKAMSKEPADRYSTAGAFAEDLRRFLQDEPILARPPSLRDLAVKWTRRHKSLALSTMAMLLLTAVGLAVSTFLIAREQGKTQAAFLGERDRAADARRQRERADASFRRALEAVDFFTRIAAEDLAGKPQAAQARKEMLEAALAYYQGLLEEPKSDPWTDERLAAARGRVSSLLAELLAFDEFSQVLARARLLEEPSVRDELKLTSEQEGLIRQFTADFPAGALQALRDVRERDRRRPDDAQDVAGMFGAADTRLDNFLRDEQRDRLRQVVRQLRGPFAFTDPDVVAALVLSALQKETVRKVQAELRTALDQALRRSGPLPGDGASIPAGPSALDRPAPGDAGDQGDQMDRLRRAALDKILAELEPPQLLAWTRLCGEPFTGNVSPAALGRVSGAVPLAP